MYTTLHLPIPFKLLKPSSCLPDCSQFEGPHQDLHCSYSLLVHQLPGWMVAMYACQCMRHRSQPSIFSRTETAQIAHTPEPGEPIS